MTDTTHTKAGLLADAGATRLRVAAPFVSCLTGAALVPATSGTAQHQVFGSHLSSTWTKGAIAKPATYTVFDGMNRPTRPLSELSP